MRENRFVANYEDEQDFMAVTPNSKTASSYIAMLRSGFNAYHRTRFGNAGHLFEERPEGGAVVFRRENTAANLLTPPFASAEERKRIVELIPKNGRHLYFGSMQSSQALAQSVFGVIKVLDRVSSLCAITAEDGNPAFAPQLNDYSIEFEKSVATLGEPRPTSVDVWFEGIYRIAVECKLAESGFGRCSRPRLTERNNEYPTQYCDGTYTRQRERTSRCALTEIGVLYWKYMDALFGWSADVEHDPCPLELTYQLARNVLAACVREDGKLAFDRGHALIIFDQRNPAMVSGGVGDQQWQLATSALRSPALLRRLSWQSFIAQWPNDPVLDWLKAELAAKYGLRPS